MSDLINRAEVIAHFQRIKEASSTNGQYNEGFVDGLDFCISFISMLPSAHGNTPTDTPTDLISRQEAIDALLEKGKSSRRYKLGEIWELNFDEIREVLNNLSPAEPEITLGDIKKYCEKRGLVILTSDFYNEMKSRCSSAQPEVKNILYPDCANAMLMMWMDDVLTDDEYNRIMDKLNEHEKKNGNAMQG